ncbi:MAG: hypothetical protein IPK93_02185 [Solirubrobacterales bacterium]|nr:hypothetical protein [Solirubrobacterales bacterium]
MLNMRTGTLVATGILVALALGTSSVADAATVKGHATSGGRALGSLKVTLHQTVPGRSHVKKVAGDVTSRSGAFRINYRRPSNGSAMLYLTSRKPGKRFYGGTKGSKSSLNPRPNIKPGPVRLAASLGPAPFHQRVTLNERTTVATGFAFAQFVHGSLIHGNSPGMENADLMARNLVRFKDGRLSHVIKTAPNGGQTLTRKKFNSLANLLVPCARNQKNCGKLFKLARAKGEKKPKGALEAAAAIARSSWSKVDRIFSNTLSGTAPYSPALGESQAPDSWGLFLSFDGDGKSLDGPGNIAIDEEGALWVNNNYTYNEDPQDVSCGSNELFKFTPDGKFAKGSPFSGGGLAGAGYGIGLDPTGHVWVGNFGFSGVGCANPPAANSVSKFRPDGTPKSPTGIPGVTGGYTAGDIDWPQASVSDPDGKIWIANCGNDSVTTYADGRPSAADNISGLGIERPFSIAFNRKGVAFVTGNRSDSIGMINPDGKPKSGSPVSGGGITRPMGIAADTNGNMWVANSDAVDVPCPVGFLKPKSTSGSLTMVSSEGKISQGKGFIGGGLTIPWGIAVDGNDTVWVANFYRQRVSQFCGTSPGKCPAGKKTGDPISPNGTGYGYDGLTRNTGIQIDPTGNIWTVNNWQINPVLSNPGGHELVVMIGAAGPLKTPLIGTPRRAK